VMSEVLGLMQPFKIFGLAIATVLTLHLALGAPAVAETPTFACSNTRCVGQTGLCERYDNHDCQFGDELCWDCSCIGGCWPPGG
jgi:hypothetical protein